MIIKENIEDAVVVDTVAKVKQGDTFIILLNDYASIYIMTDSDLFVDLFDGDTYEVCDHSDYPVRKIDFKLTKLEK